MMYTWCDSLSKHWGTALARDECYPAARFLFKTKARIRINSTHCTHIHFWNSGFKCSINSICNQEGSQKQSHREIYWKQISICSPALSISLFQSRVPVVQRKTNRRVKTSILVYGLLEFNFPNATAWEVCVCVCVCVYCKGLVRLDKSKFTFEALSWYLNQKCLDCQSMFILTISPAVHINFDRIITPRDNTLLQLSHYISTDCRKQISIWPFFLEIKIFYGPTGF